MLNPINIFLRPKEKNKYYVFIDSGQSNNNGHAYFVNFPAYTNPYALAKIPIVVDPDTGQLITQNNIEALEIGVNNVIGETPLQEKYWGPEVEFCKQMEGYLNEEFGIAKYGPGATDIAKFQKNGGTTIYERLLASCESFKNHAISQNKQVEFVSFSWFQGEDDCLLGTTKADYKTLLGQLVSDLRADLVSLTGKAKYSDLPVLVGRLSDQQDGAYTSGNLSIIQDAQSEFVTEQIGEGKNTVLYNTDLYQMQEPTFDLHFDSVGQISHGLARFNIIKNYL